MIPERLAGNPYSDMVFTVQTAGLTNQTKSVCWGTVGESGSQWEPENTQHSGRPEIAHAIPESTSSTQAKLSFRRRVLSDSLGDYQRTDGRGIHWNISTVARQQASCAAAQAIEKCDSRRFGAIFDSRHRSLPRASYHRIIAGTCLQSGSFFGRTTQYPFLLSAFLRSS